MFLKGSEWPAVTGPEPCSSSYLARLSLTSDRTSYLQCSKLSSYPFILLCPQPVLTATCVSIMELSQWALYPRSIQRATPASGLWENLSLDLADIVIELGLKQNQSANTSFYLSHIGAGWHSTSLESQLLRRLSQEYQMLTAILGNEAKHLKRKKKGRVAGSVIQWSSIILVSTRPRIQSPIQESRSHLEGLF